MLEMNCHSKKEDLIGNDLKRLKFHSNANAGMEGSSVGHSTIDESSYVSGNEVHI